MLIHTTGTDGLAYQSSPLNDASPIALFLIPCSAQEKMMW